MPDTNRAVFDHAAIDIDRLADLLMQLTSEQREALEIRLNLEAIRQLEDSRGDLTAGATVPIDIVETVSADRSIATVRVTVKVMAVHKAVVRDGFLEMKEPTKLPEGTVVPLFESEDPYAHLDDADELDENDRTKLHAALKHSWSQAEAGQRGRSLDEILKNP